MDSFNVFISDHAYNMLDDYITYIQYELRNPQAAKSLWDDAVKTRNKLADNAEHMRFCENETLRKLGYRRILFLRHEYVMIYRIEGENVYVDAIYHQMQDYEHHFIKYTGVRE